MTKTFVFLIRHGEIGDYSFDSPLNKKGKQQANELAARLEFLKDEVNVIYSSPLLRAVETALIVSKKINKKIVKVHYLSEFGKDFWRSNVFSKSFWVNYKKYRNVVNVFDKILEKNTGDKIIIIAHGNVIRGILRQKMGLSFADSGNININHCYSTLLEFNGKKLNHVYYINSKDVEKPEGWRNFWDVLG